MNPDRFPLLGRADARVPVRCLTPATGACMHRFFDTSPVSPSGRYLAVFRLPREDRPPLPGEQGDVRIVDLDTGGEFSAGASAGWEPQLGANLNWGASDHELFHNDVDTSDWTPFAWRCDPLRGVRERLDGTVYHASPDGRWLLSADLSLMGKTQGGYGVVLPEGRRPSPAPGPREDDGFFITDARTGRRRLFVSLRRLFTAADPAIGEPAPGTCEIQAFHCKFNARGDRAMLSVRWFPHKGRPRWNMFAQAYPEVRYAWATASVSPEGLAADLRCAVGPEHWARGGHHATWCPDGDHISMNLVLEEGGPMRLARVRHDGAGLRALHPELIGTGHPTLHPDGRHVLTDTYLNEPGARSDGRVPLRWLDLATGREDVLWRVPSRPPAGATDPVMRCDPHPAWTRDRSLVVFNAIIDGTRRVCAADMRHAPGL